MMVLLAIATASSSVSYGVTVITGPKISVCAIVDVRVDVGQQGRLHVITDRKVLRDTAAGHQGGAAGDGGLVQRAQRLLPLGLADLRAPQMPGVQDPQEVSMMVFSTSMPRHTGCAATGTRLDGMQLCPT